MVEEVGLGVGRCFSKENKAFACSKQTYTRRRLVSAETAACLSGR